MSTPPMDIDDDLYSNEGEAVATITATKAEQSTNKQAVGDAASESKGDFENDAEEAQDGEREDEDEDSDIDIIIDHQDEANADSGQQPKPSDSCTNPQRSTLDETTGKTSAAEDDTKHTPNTASAASTHLTGDSEVPTTAGPSSTTSVAPLPVPSADSEAKASSSSKIDINSNPIYKPAGKPIMSVVIDTDLGENDKPWRQPGTDVSDYFNYGFDEFTWALYAVKQENIRNEFNADAVLANQKKMMEEFNSMMMGGMPGGIPGGMPGGGMDPSMMPPEMQQMLQQMMGGGGGTGMGGMDMSQMDASMFNGGGNVGNGPPSSITAGGGNSEAQGGVSGNQEGFNGNTGVGQFGGMQGAGDFGRHNNGGGFMGRGRGGRSHWYLG
ncbi:Cleavage polyadenylation factor subunit fip1 [Ceratocystis pirilliformis]|uniref:Cleavage polyadenylation factor subunit fip1 n=1 Tax=Ceratocystis pirilliformis TaxID=259994 RepID=A0ABR3ZAV7_9PEZI